MTEVRRRTTERFTPGTVNFVDLVGTFKVGRSGGAYATKRIEGVRAQHRGHLGDRADMATIDEQYRPGCHRQPYEAGSGSLAAGLTVRAG